MQKWDFESLGDCWPRSKSRIKWIERCYYDRKFSIIVYEEIPNWNSNSRNIVITPISLNPKFVKPKVTNSIKEVKSLWTWLSPHYNFTQALHSRYIWVPNFGGIYLFGTSFDILWIVIHGLNQWEPTFRLQHVWALLSHFTPCYLLSILLNDVNFPTLDTWWCVCEALVHMCPKWLPRMPISRSNAKRQ